MHHRDRRLLRHLGLAVAIKLVLLALLWWAFVRDHRVHVDPGRIEALLGPTMPSPGEPK